MRIRILDKYKAESEPQESEEQVMAEFPTYEEMAKNKAEKVLDEFLYDGKSIREWMQIITSEDCISRQSVLNKKELVELEDGQSFYCISPKDVETLPSVTPIRPKGHWVNKSRRSGGGEILFVASECTCCGKRTLFNCDEFLYRYCPNCGAKMESEVEK